jgi:hypothetical protein
LAEFSLVYTLATPGGTITFNSGSDQYVIARLTGLDGAPIRAPMNNRPQAHGGLVHRFLLGPRHLTIEGLFHVTSSATESGYKAARRTMDVNLNNALNSILAADGTLTWTPSGGSALNLYVRHDQPLQVGGAWVKTFVFGLVAADPTPF